MLTPNPSPEPQETAIADQRLAEGKSQNAIFEDWRHISNGREIPSEFYADQPYIVDTDDDAWLCVMTTGSGREGQSGQHVVSMRSTDQGRSWEDPVKIEPDDGPEASWAVALKVPGGRIYAFYVHNTDNLREIKADNPPYSTGYASRMDSFGYYVYKYSDDDGRSWSAQRTTIPVREFEIDRENAYAGKVRYFWNVGRPFIHNQAAYLSIHKVGGLGFGWFTSSEGALLRSESILTESDPANISWETLPDGEVGLRTPHGGGPVAEEHSYSTLSDGTFYSVYRTIDGYPACAYSGDGGHTWTTPAYKTYADGRRMKNPRAANFAWGCENGKFIYWFHNHGGRFILEHPQRRTIAYSERNPVWLSGGIEIDTPAGKRIQWSEPEIALYDDDPYVRMSYPDLTEHGGRYFLSETQKFIARTHEISPGLLEGMWNSFESTEIARQGLILNVSEATPSQVLAPALPRLTERDNTRHDYGTRDLRAGISLDLWVRFDSLHAGQRILDNRTDGAKGFCLATTDHGTVELILNDGRTDCRWECDPDRLQAGTYHHIVVIVDGGPKIISFVVDGGFCEGGDHRQYGWGRYSPNLQEVNGGEYLRIGDNLDGDVRGLRIYDRALRTAEAVGNFRGGPGTVRTMASALTT